MKQRLIALFVALLAITTLHAEVKLPTILGSNMVIQRNSNPNIWGWAAPNTTIKIKTSWSKGTLSTTSDSEGKWLISLLTGDAMWDQTITIDDGDKLTLTNVMIGDVWICSGQSNMEMPLMGFNTQRVEYSTDALIEAHRYPNLKLFTVEKTSAHEPAEDCPKYRAWSDASADNIANFSATAYFFGRTLASFVTDIPIGLVHTSWGGTRIEAWLSEKCYDNLPAEVDKEKMLQKGNQEKGVSKLYNGMIHPIKNYTAKGFIWYQGEANRRDYRFYHYVMSSMVSDWREDWGDETMPFYYVQIAPYIYEGLKHTILPLMIESQVKALDLIPYSGMAATTDIGHTISVHPTHKKEVGERLAFLALRNDYGIKSVPLPAPTLKEAIFKGAEVTVSFNNMSADFEEFNNTLAFYQDDTPFSATGFEMAGEDKVFYPAKATINRGDNTITVKCNEVATPVSLRYAFYNVHNGNVKTCVGQPLVPFRTDRWIDINEGGE